jgi:hypothetical protein
MSGNEHPDIIPATLAFCRKLKIRAKYLREVHGASPLGCGDLKCAHEPPFVQIYPPPRFIGVLPNAARPTVS